MGIKILQFGTGRFLRGFFAPIVKSENSIAVIQSRANSNGAEEINAQPDGYHVWTRGIKNGRVVDEFERVRSIDRAVIASQQWAELCELALNEELQLIVSNTTAAGMQLDDRDNKLEFIKHCPNSFPAKLTALLFLRFQNKLPGLTFLPLELVDQNGDTLKRLVVEQSKIWSNSIAAEFIEWLDRKNRWLNNLVDRIVVSPSEAAPWEGDDRLAVVGEPFRMLAIEDDGKGKAPIPDHEMIIWTENLANYFKRKVRILNGLHTAMVAKFSTQGYRTVLECVSDPASRKWIDQLLFEEILPTLAASGSNEETFAREVLERFENPFFKHLLSDIAQGHETKLKIRIEPTAHEFREAFGREPTLLNEVLNATFAQGSPI